MRIKDYKVYESGGSGSGGGNDKRFTYTMAAVFCAAIVMVLAVFTVRANPQWMARNDDNRINLTDNPPREEYLDIHTPETDVVQPVPTVDSLDYDPQVESQGEGGGSSSAFVMPVEGNIVTSHTESVYSRTLEHYSAHVGIDIEAPLDTPVLAAQAGTVIAVYNDDKLGLSIEINHGNGLITKYSNLSTDKLVGESDVVEKGDPISGVGSTALFESMEVPHVHFEVFKDGESVDPMEYFQ